MSKIVVCTGTLSSGGAERVLSILSKYLADTYDQVEYIMWLDHKNPEVFYRIDPRVKIIGISQQCKSSNILKHLLWFRRHIKDEKPNVILSFMVMINLSVIVSLLGTKNNIIVAERNDPRYFAHGKLLRRIINLLYHLKMVKHVLMQTINNKNYFTSKKVFNKTSVIYNPITLKPEFIGSALKTPKENCIVSVGRLSSQKQQNILIESFEIFRQNHPEYKLIIYGEGDKRGELEEIISEHGLNHVVLLPGTTSNVLDLIKSAKMFVMTSQYEGMSNSLIEAMCLGLPVISTKVSGAIDLISHSQNGYLVEIGDSKAIAHYMSLIANDSKSAQKLGAEAQKIYNLLSVDKISNQWIETLKKFE